MRALGADNKKGHNDVMSRGKLTDSDYKNINQMNRGQNCMHIHTILCIWVDNIVHAVESDSTRERERDSMVYFNNVLRAY